MTIVSSINKHTDTWLQILRKQYGSDAVVWEYCSFFLRNGAVSSNSIREGSKILFVCWYEHESTWETLREVLNPSSSEITPAIELILADSSHLYLIVLAKWHQWNSSLFWTLVKEVNIVEAFSGMYCDKGNGNRDADRTGHC